MLPPKPSRGKKLRNPQPSRNWSNPYWLDWSVTAPLAATAELTRSCCAAPVEVKEMTAGALAASRVGLVSTCDVPVESTHLATGWLLAKPSSEANAPTAFEAWNTRPVLINPGTLTAAIAKCGSAML